MINLENYQFNYSVKGSKNKPPLVFLHGFMGSCNDFSEISDVLSEDFYCLAIDLPGHGKTKVFGGTENYTIQNTTNALIQCLDRLGIEKTSLVGYSMGGRLALYMMLNDPSRFERAALESASPGLRTEEARSQRRKADWQLAQKLETREFQEFLLDWYNQPLFQSFKEHPMFESNLKRRLENNPRELAKSLRFMGTGNQPSLWERLTINQIPLLLLVGERDEKFRKINTEIASIAPHTQLEIVPKAGHNVHFENPTGYLKSLTQFLMKFP